MSYRISVSDNRRFLVRDDGTPFFYLADTAWELFHRLSREEADVYLRNRAARRFTVIQAVALAEMDGLNTANVYGHKPLRNNDPTRPDEDYFSHVDWVVNRAEQLGLFTALLPTWGDKWCDLWGTGPVVFTTENARIYGEMLGKRYRDKPIIWVLGGDRPVEKPQHVALLRAMAEGLAKGDNGSHAMTLHPRGGASSSQYVHQEPWLDFNMMQSGHCGRDNANHEMIRKDLALEPAKPTLDGEPCYEDHPVMTASAEKGWFYNPADGFFGQHDVRKLMYRALFAGACGHTYGCHPIWMFWQHGRDAINNVRTPWRDAIELPGAAQVQHGRALVESRPYLTRVPDQSLLASGAGSGADHAQACRDADGSYAFVYLPSGKPVNVDLKPLARILTAWWYDPRTGEAACIGEVTGRAQQEFTPPCAGTDWVLVLDDRARGYAKPGRG